MTSPFMATLNRQILKTKEDVIAVARNAIQDVVSDAQTTVPNGGNMPIITGTLRNSLVSEVNGSRIGEGEESYVLATNQIKAGDVAFFIWTAEYSRRVHSGFVGQDSLGRSFNQEGRFWAMKAAANFQSYVDEQTRRLL